MTSILDDPHITVEGSFFEQRGRVVDDFKANRMKINLITDQLLHLLQILVTFAVLN